MRGKPSSPGMLSVGVPDSPRRDDPFFSSPRPRRGWEDSGIRSSNHLNFTPLSHAPTWPVATSLTTLFKMRSVVWQFFDYVDGKKTEVKCLWCQQRLKYNPKDMSTKSMMDHLRGAHNAPQQLPRPSLPQIDIRSFQKTIARTDEQKMAYIAFIAVDLQPFSNVESAGFRAVCRLASSFTNPPSRQTVREWVLKKHLEVRQEVRLPFLFGSRSLTDISSSLTGSPPRSHLQQR